jgi:hypothetical protein
MKMITPPDVTSEMCRLYRRCLDEKITPDTLQKLTGVLGKIRDAKVEEQAQPGDSAYRGATVNTVNIIAVPTGHHFDPLTAAELTRAPLTVVDGKWRRKPPADDGEAA